MSEDLRRRDALRALGGLGVGAAAWQLTRGGWPLETAQAANCVLAPEVTEGPFWVANHLTRRDITDGRPGLPLWLHLTIVDATTCKPIKGADVEVWHADAGGVYSGVNGNARRFLRGHQRADSSGEAIFRTIYPGWYRGRTPHIHVKVHVGGSVVHTGQVFFRDATSAAVYRTSHYRWRGQPDTSNGRDGIYAQAGGSKALLHLIRRAGGGYIGAITLGVRR